MVETTTSKKPIQLGNKEDQNPRKFYSRFLFKALIIALLCSLVPVFLSQTPELANQTRLLELLHLILVGIAFSYGLFSRRNYDGGGGGLNHNDHKPDHNNAYVAKILEVSSVFNVEHESGSDDSSGYHHRKFQTWRNKHHMKGPETVLSKDQDESRFVREKPLLLPVRSLNYSRVSDSGRWERVRSKRQLLKSLVDGNSDALPSPIPWRSRSSKEIESQSLIKTPANLTSSLTPLPKLKSESGAKEYHFHASPSPPPPPPPPPLPAFYNSAPRKDYPPRSYRESVQKKKLTGGEFHHPPPPPPPPPMDYYKSPPTKLRVRSEQKMKLDIRSSPTKVWWSDPIAETKEDIREDMNKNDGRGFLGSKATEEPEDKEYMIKGNEIHEEGEHSEIEEKKIEEEGSCGNISDVDKKADEFIAKFREQIRLQRIESIKRSAYKISPNSSR
ncbi:unnamed protein product [Eruca vesicaria subsp. sativa]|uniref:Hydroxyproline-rich glycoprotein family protein n=1 Tax=Eruca vesicaria subsp. sativa TaxID=29727 RepID=A0ABC8K7N2_ERUVS|nr:unnamed protein product [Eruca vesicaria subsp. sativa]